MPNKNEEIAAIARTWLATPFFPHQAIKGVGADCVSLVLQIYKEAGAAPLDELLPPYKLGQGNHLLSSIVINWLEKAPYMERSPARPAPGNVITMQIGKVIHHVGLMSGETTFIHAIRNYGVIEADLRDSTWSDRLRSCWRLKDVR